MYRSICFRAGFRTRRLRFASVSTIIIVFDWRVISHWLLWIFWRAYFCIMSNVVFVVSRSSGSLLVSHESGQQLLWLPHPPAQRMAPAVFPWRTSTAVGQRS